MHYHDIKYSTDSGTGDFYLSQLSKLMSLVSKYSIEPRVIKYRNSTSAETTEFTMTTENSYNFIKR